MAEIGKEPLKKLYRSLRIYFKVLYNLISFKPDVVYVVVSTVGIGLYKDFLVILLLKLLGKKPLIHLHNKGVKRWSKKRLNRMVYNIIFGKSHVILLSKKLYFDVEDYIYEREVFYCGNGIVNTLNTTANPYLKTNVTPKLLFLSNLMESKGVLILLEALGKLSVRGLDFHCILVGKPADITISALNKKIQILNIESKVTYVGAKYGEEKEKIFLDSDIFVFPTLEDCFPLVILEAMHYGLPCITTNEGAIPDMIIHGESGIITEKGNIDQLSEAITELLKHPEKTQAMGKASRMRFLEEFTIEKMENRFLEIINSVNEA